MKIMPHISIIACFLSHSAFASYAPISMIERDSDFLVIGKIVKIEDGYATLESSHTMRNLSRQLSKREEADFRFKVSEGEVSIGDYGIWVAESKNRLNSQFKLTKVPKDYPHYEKLGELIRTREYIHQNSPWVGFWRSEDDSIEIYLGESGFGFYRKDGNVLHCLWSIEIDPPIAIYTLSDEGRFEHYDLLSAQDKDTLISNKTQLRFKKESSFKSHIWKEEPTK